MIDFKFSSLQLILGFYRKKFCLYSTMQLHLVWIALSDKFLSLTRKKTCKWATCVRVLMYLYVLLVPFMNKNLHIHNPNFSKQILYSIQVLSLYNNKGKEIFFKCIRCYSNKARKMKISLKFEHGIELLFTTFWNINSDLKVFVN